MCTFWYSVVAYPSGDYGVSSRNWHGWIQSERFIAAGRQVRHSIKHIRVDAFGGFVGEILLALRSESILDFRVD